MSCEAEQATVNRLSQQWAAKKATCAGICASLGHDSQECEGCQAEAEDIRSELAQAQSDLAKCLAANPPEATTRLLQATGYVTFLRVNEPGSGFGGGATNWFDADVIFKLDSRPDKGFGFQLRDDSFQPVRQGMLALLQVAVTQRLQVTTDYLELVMPPNNNSFVIRIALQNIPQPTPKVPPGHLAEL